MLVAVESAPPNPSKPPSACSILVVDDESASGELIATLLRSQGYNVRLAADGREALPIIARGGVDLLLCDLMMSRMDGVEVCAHVRNELRDPLLPIVITTSLNDRESRIRAKEAGADDVLIKPIDGLEMLVRIECLLRARAHVGLVLRERDQLRAELTEARAALGTQQRALRTIEGAAEALHQLMERQHVKLENAGKRWPTSADTRDEVQRFAQIANELSELMARLSGNTLRISEADQGSDTSELHSPVSAAK